MGASTVQPLSSATQKKRKQGNDLVTVPSHIFAENVAPTTIVERLPDPDERLTSTPQLASCLGILKNSRLLDDILQPDTRKWLHAVENDEDEQERLKVLATDVIRTFKKDEIKDARSVNEVVCLAPVLEKDLFRDLLMEFYNGVDHSGLLDFYQVEGLAQIIQGASPGYLHADDLVRILRLLTTRLRETHKQSPQHMYQLTLAASYVLDAMADTSVEGLDRETLHEPLLSYLDSLKGSSDPFLIYQAAYAYQALLCVPDNETLWQATFRRAGKVIKGVSGLVSAVKGFDLKEFIDGLKDIQQGLAGASDAIKVVISTIDDVKSLTSGGKGLLDGLKEGFSFQRKCTCLLHSSNWSVRHHVDWIQHSNGVCVSDLARLPSTRHWMHRLDEALSRSSERCITTMMTGVINKAPKNGSSSFSYGCHHPKEARLNRVPRSRLSRQVPAWRP
ncbi:hypothetical protein B0O80DRAFT_448659 [Mortierella sp. GBAus27b]|nr:hypothetical protein B0O80DRAFT_448659 [Mortierella sp. GBAus27b]